MLVVNEGKLQTQNQTIRIVALDVLYKLPYSVVSSFLNCELKKPETITPPFWTQPLRNRK